MKLTKSALVILAALTSNSALAVLRHIVDDEINSPVHYQAVISFSALTTNDRNSNYDSLTVLTLDNTIDVKSITDHQNQARHFSSNQVGVAGYTLFGYWFKRGWRVRTD